MDFSKVHQELKRKGVTLQLLWHEYKEVEPDGYSYSRYCELYKHWRGKLSMSMRQVHRAGEKAFVDFAGMRPVVTNAVTGETREVELFVGVLGASSYVYADAVENQRLTSWLPVHQRMLEFFGGVPEVIVPDCLKSGVTKASRYEPEVNRAYQDLAEHYGAVIIPARPRRPKDKAKAEVAVQVVERWLLATLRNRIFFSLAELNQALRAKLEWLNDRRMRHVGASRRELFEKLDKPVLRALPSAPYELREWAKVRANIDYHVEVDGCYYSVPYQLRGHELEARYTATTVEVLHRNVRVTSHARLHTRGESSTKPEHMPASHRGHAEWSPSKLLDWARSIGPSTGQLAAEILRLRPHPEQGYRSCLGLKRLSKSHGVERLEAACRRACWLGSYEFGTVLNILSARQESPPLEEDVTPAKRTPHPNVRGSGYYSAEVN